MRPLKGLLASDSRQTLEFFFIGLRELSEPTVDRHELLYNASVLAHYAQTSTRSTSDLPTPANLTAVFDTFVLGAGALQDTGLTEAAAAQCLLMAGFFEDQMRGRHSIRWYSQLGAGFYHRAAAQEPSIHKARLLSTLGHRFEPWRRRHAQLSRQLREQAYLLRPPAPPAIM